MPAHSRYVTQLTDLAATQDGLVTAAQLAALGVPRSSVQHRLQAGGMWSRILPGVHLVSGGSPDRRQRERAALLYAGDASVLTGLTALRRFGVRAGRLQESDDDRRRPETVHVLLPHRLRRVSTSFVRVERTTRMPRPDEAVVLDGFPLAPVARATADAARRMRGPADTRALVTDVVRLGLCDVDLLRRELEAGATRGSRHLRDAITHLAAGVWSGPEADLRELVVGLPLPQPLWNVRVLTAAGRFVGLPDAWFDDVALAVEVDSREHHADGRDWERTLERQRRYAEHGVVVVPITPAHLRRAPDGVAASLVAAYRAAARRPRPAVRIESPLPTIPGERLGTSWGG